MLSPSFLKLNRLWYWDIIYSKSKKQTSIWDHYITEERITEEERIKNREERIKKRIKRNKRRIKRIKRKNKEERRKKKE